MEQVKLFVDILKCWNRNMWVSDTGLDECLCLLIVLAIHSFVGLGRKKNDLVYKAFSDLIEIDEVSTSCSQDVQSFI